jgi:hypothetical protein
MQGDKIDQREKKSHQEDKTRIGSKTNLVTSPIILKLPP